MAVAAAASTAAHRLTFLSGGTVLPGAAGACGNGGARLCASHALVAGCYVELSVNSIACDTVASQVPDGSRLSLAVGLLGKNGHQGVENNLSAGSAILLGPVCGALRFVRNGV